MNASPTSRCPEPAELTRQSSEGLSSQLRTHLAECPRCARDWQAEIQLAGLGPELPHQPPSAERQARVRARLLERANAQPPWPRLVTSAAPSTTPASRPPAQAWHRLRRPLRVGVALGGVAALAAGVALVFQAIVGQPEPPLTTLSPSAPSIRGPARLQASSGARFALESAPPHERVRLHQGALRVDVEPARHGESFRIITSQGEVEVRGTIFDAEADSDRLIAVRVYRGRVVVRPQQGAADVILQAGDHWQRQAPAVAPAPLVMADDPATAERPRRPKHRAPPQARPRTPATSPVPAPPSSWRSADPPATEPTTAPATTGLDVSRGREAPSGDGPSNRAFGTGLRLLRAGRSVEAAAAFEDAARLSPIGPLAEDAWYWRAIALARSGATASRNALAAFIDRYPLSPRRGEVSVMLGWLLLGVNDPAGAEPRFRAGLQDRSARVRDSAQAGLNRLAGREKNQQDDQDSAP